jgi:hypothetical protein
MDSVVFFCLPEAVHLAANIALISLVHCTIRLAKWLDFRIYWHCICTVRFNLVNRHKTNNNGVLVTNFIVANKLNKKIVKFIVTIWRLHILKCHYANIFPVNALLTPRDYFIWIIHLKLGMV